MTGKEFEIDAWRAGMNVRCMDGWMDEDMKSRQESYEYYSVGEKA